MSAICDGSTFLYMISSAISVAIITDAPENNEVILPDNKSRKISVYNDLTLLKFRLDRINNGFEFKL